MTTEVTAAEFVREFRRRIREASTNEVIAGTAVFIERLEIAETDPRDLDAGQEGVDARSPDMHNWLTEYWLNQVATELALSSTNLIPQSGVIWRMTW
jgi:hypothetical protein